MRPLRIPIRGDKLYMIASVKQHIHHERTRFQTIDILDTDAFGRVLMLDGHVQLTEMDEHAYHESLAQIPLLSIDAPTRALVIGGGDGGVIREVCKHPGIQHVDIVEIDEGVVAACRAHLPSVSHGAFDDLRVRLHIADAFDYVRTCDGRYDLIVADSTDIYEEEDGGLSEMLFSDAFYEDCRAALRPEGILVTQADNLVFCPYSLDRIHGMFQRIFPVTGSYFGLVPSFGGFSGFCWAGASADVRLADALPRAARGITLRYLDARTYALAFAPVPF